MHPSRRIFGAALAVAAIVAVAPAARADVPDATRAKEAYDRGVRAHAAGDHRAAARAFAEADGIAPANASLEAALESAMRADDAVLGAELLDRSASRTPDASLAKTIAAARRRFAGRVGKIRVACGASPTCVASVDGVAADAKKPIYVRAGAHSVVVQREDRTERLVDVPADGTVDVSPDAVRAPEPAPAAATAPLPRTAPEPAHGGISPVFFYVGLGLTTALGAVTVLSGIHTLKVHDRFEHDGCNEGATGPRAPDCGATSDAGKTSTLETNVLLGATAALAIATATTGVLLVKWADGTSVRARGAAAPGAAFAGLELRTR